MVLVAVGVLALVAAIAQLSLRETARSSFGTGRGLGACGSIMQGSIYDDGGTSHAECARIRSADVARAVGLLIIAVAATGAGIGLMIYRRRSISDHAL